jgi:carbon-monoxide dehydrogenase medium subunit
MIPAAVDYVRADSAEAAIAALVEHGDEAKLLAGGQSLVPLMRLRLATPTVLVDVGRATDLVGISVEGDTVSIGALTTHSTLEHSAELAERLRQIRYLSTATVRETYTSSRVRL